MDKPPSGPPAECVLAIDLGGSGPKVALVSTSGEVLDHERSTVTTHYLEGGGVEQDAEEWWRVITAAIQRMMQRRRALPERIIGVAAASQWSVTVPTDGHGHAIGPAIHWMDGRGGDHSRAMMNGWLKISGYEVRKLAKWLRRTAGVPLFSGADSLSHILFLKQERPQIYAAARWLLEPMDFLGLRMTGRCATSAASVFPYLLANNRKIHDVRYCEDLITIAGIAPAKLPEILPVNTILGPLLAEVADTWGVQPGIPVTIGSGDSQVAVLGSGAIQTGELHLCMGTSGSIGCLVEGRRFDLFRGLTSVPSVVPGRYMASAELGLAGRTLELLAEQWFGASGPEGYANLFEAAAQVTPGCAGLLFLPWLNGCGPPDNDPHMRGALLNLDVRCGPERIVRAVMEGIACSIRWLVDAVDRFVGQPSHAIRFIGGTARSDAWCQILADVLGRDVLQVEQPHFAIARGCALGGMMRLGRMELSDLPAKVRIAATYEPDLDLTAVYQDLYTRFHRARKATKRLRGQRFYAY